MPKTFAPMRRHFSAIQKFQRAYTLIYSLNADAGGCWLTLSRTGESEQADSLFLPDTPENCYGLLQYMCENAVQPEIWRDVIAEFYPSPGRM